MPRYFFDFRSTDGDYDDVEGSECRDDEAALCEAGAAACELTADRLRRGLTIGEAVFEVRDANGRIVASVPFPQTIAPQTNA